MSSYSSSSAFEKKTLVGLWWIPNQEKKCYGTLYFDLDGEQKLCVIGELEDYNVANCSELPRYSIIHGICRDEGQIKYVTILDATCIRRLTPMLHRDILSEIDISFRYVWIGTNFYDNRDDIVFSSFYFGLNNLEIWCDTTHIFSATFDGQSNKISAEMTIPDPIVFFVDENVTISVVYREQPPDSRIGQTESTIRCVPQIRISANKGSMPYYGDNDSFEHYLFFIFHLFEIFFWGQTFFFCMNGYKAVISSERGIIPFMIQEELLFSRDITLKQRKKLLIPDNVLFPYQVIKSNLSDLVLAFHQNYQKTRVILDSVLSSICTTSYGMDSLPLLMFSMEGLQQIFFHSLGEGTSPENISDYTAFDSMKEQIIQLCNTEDQKAFVKRTISWRKTFRDRLLTILLDQKDVFSFLDDDVCNSLANDLKKIRNDAAHSDERDLNQILTPLYRGQLSFVQFLHVAIIMKVCGVSAETIRCRFENYYNYPFREMSEILRNHYVPN